MDRPMWSSEFYWPPAEIEARQARVRALFCVAGPAILWSVGLVVGMVLGAGVYAVALAGLLGIIGAGSGYVLGCGTTIGHLRQRFGTHRSDEYRIAQTELTWGSGIVVGTIGGLVTGLLVVDVPGPLTQIIAVGGLTAAGAVAGGAVIGTIAVIVFGQRWAMMPKAITVLPGAVAALGILPSVALALEAQAYLAEHAPWSSGTAVVLILLLGTLAAAQFGWWTMMGCVLAVVLVGPYSDRNA